MKKATALLLTFSFLIVASVSFAQDKKPERKQLYENGVYNPYEVLDTRVDNMRYWRKAAELGLTPVEMDHIIPKAVEKSSRISAKSVWREDSPDVPVTDENSTQSENSIFVDPTDPDHVLQSNNSTQNPVGSLYGANYFFSFDFGETWGGSIQGAGGGNSGDPATAISLTGRQYVGFIHNNYGQGVSYSDDGVNWTSVIADAGSGSSILDKNHMWIDNSPTSPYEGNIYAAWTDFGGPNDSDIEIVYSNDNGLSYSNAVNISSQLNAGSHNQGVNIETGPDGQVYVVWTIYDSWPSDESALGFAKSYDGGVTWGAPSRIISNIRGIRTSETSKNHRVNSFPVMTCDLSGDGTLYVVWSNIGEPGVNTGSDIDVYMIKSSDEGETWSDPIRVSQDEPGQGNESYFPWITCDPVTGALSVVFYDDRDVNSNQAEAWCANSFDGGETWEDFRVSDVAFTPSPIPGLAGGYMGDYLGISARDARVYPVWADNRGGYIMTYTSPYETNSLPRPVDLTASVTFETGAVDLAWEMEEVPGFQYFIIYRDDFEIAQTTDKFYSDNLPDYGIYKYKVTAFHDEGESSGPSASVQWGDAHVAVDPTEIIENIDLMSQSTRTVTVENVGELELIYEVSGTTEPVETDGTDEYCVPTANCSFGDGITSFAMADISNLGSGCSASGYGDFTDMSTELQLGNEYEITLATDYDSQYVNIWIDHDKDEEFEADELILEGFELANAGQNYTVNVTLPDDFQSGETRMRVKAEWLDVPTDPCADMSYGETEDYTVNISGWMYLDRFVDTLNPGNTNTFEILFVSDDLTEGTYYGNVKIESNDPEAPEVNIPVTLNVGGGFPLAINVSADPSTICMGESSQLEANPSGGTGAYTYSWTSDPAGFTSTDPDPMVTPDETTIYYVEVDDGETTVEGQVVVTVDHMPEQAAMPDGETDMCWGMFESVYQTTGASGADSYNWMLEPETAGTLDPNGMTVTVTWDEEFIGMATLMVQGVNDCGMGDMSDELEITMHALPEVDLGMDMTVCANEIITLDAGNTGATFMWSTGETSQTIQVDTTGVGIGSVEVWVEVTDANTCASTDTITIQFDDCTGITDYADQWGVTVYPNPSDGVFSVEIKSQSTAPVSVTLFNTFGSEVYRKDNLSISGVQAIDFDLNEKPEGIYLLNIKGDGINMIRKVVIQK
jgi:hypothetical protein